MNKRIGAISVPIVFLVTACSSAAHAAPDPSSSATPTASASSSTGTHSHRHQWESKSSSSASSSASSKVTQGTPDKTFKVVETGKSGNYLELTITSHGKSHNCVLWTGAKTTQKTTQTKTNKTTQNKNVKVFRGQTLKNLVCFN